MRRKFYSETGLSKSRFLKISVVLGKSGCRVEVALCVRAEIVVVRLVMIQYCFNRVNTRITDRAGRKTLQTIGVTYTLVVVDPVVLLLLCQLIGSKQFLLGSIRIPACSIRLLFAASASAIMKTVVEDRIDNHSLVGFAGLSFHYGRKRNNFIHAHADLSRLRFIF